LLLGGYCGGWIAAACLFLFPGIRKARNSARCQSGRAEAGNAKSPLCGTALLKTCRKTEDLYLILLAFLEFDVRE